jgi:hypothetical protein
VTLTLSPPIRIAALCALAAAVTIGAGLMLVGRKQDTIRATAVVIKHHPAGPGVAKHNTAPIRHHTAKPVRGSHVRTTVRTPDATKPLTRTKPVVPASERAALAAGLPAPLAHALGQHRVVVVELYQPRSQIDALALGEARAGAALVGAGFVQLNVLSKADVQNLTEQLGQVLPVPGIIVYTRPATLAARIGGFVDKDTVAQAAHNAAGAP